MMETSFAQVVARWQASWLIIAFPFNLVHRLARVHGHLHFMSRRLMAPITSVEAFWALTNPKAE